MITLAEHIKKNLELIAPIIQNFEDLLDDSIPSIVKECTLEHYKEHKEEFVAAKNAYRELEDLQNFDSIKKTLVGKFDDNLIAEGKL